jgi:hypothetical protein
LRDANVTEYGIADIRGKSDRDVAVAMLGIADSRFLLGQAKEIGKIERSFELQKTARNKHADDDCTGSSAGGDAGLLPSFPLGSDFSEIEERLIPALQILKLVSSTGLLALFALRIFSSSKDWDCLQRLGLARPNKSAEWLYSALVSGAP